MPHVNPNHARDDKQEALLKEIEAAGVCPFCADNLARFHTRPILKEGKYWKVTSNQHPRENADIQLLVIYKDHVEMPDEVSPEARAELWEMFLWAIDEFQLKGGGLIMRFGETNLSGSTVQHIHAHVVKPKDGTKVRFGFGL